jgi:predicted alpha/beta-hydrolase family hydrolase
LKNPNKLTIRLEAGATTALVYPAQGQAQGQTLDKALILGHGAGAGQQSQFMVGFARALSALGTDVVTFNFMYTEQGRRIPDRAPVLESCFRAVVDVVRREVKSASAGVYIGGKSMGGRIATQVAAADCKLPIDGLVLLGYPLHPPGKPAERRDKHLPLVGRPMLFVQGSRDAFGSPAELEPVLITLNPAPVLYVVNGGDHSLRLSRKDPAAQAQSYTAAQETIVSWMKTTTATTRATTGLRTPAP